MADYNRLKDQIRSLNESHIRLSTQLDSLLKQEQQEIESLRQLGVSDLDAAIALTTREVEQIKTQIESNVATLETAVS